MNKHKIIVAITGASGSIYSKVLLDKLMNLNDQIENVGIVMSPKVSIIIPCYNSEKWIEECVMSALNQSYERTEVIVIDNESKDESFEILKKIKKSNDELLLSTAENIFTLLYLLLMFVNYKLPKPI